MKARLTTWTSIVIAWAVLGCVLTACTTGQRPVPMGKSKPLATSQQTGGGGGDSSVPVSVGLVAPDSVPGGWDVVLTIVLAARADADGQLVKLTYDYPQYLVDKPKHLVVPPYGYTATATLTTLYDQELSGTVTITVTAISLDDDYNDYPPAAAATFTVVY